MARSRIAESSGPSTWTGAWMLYVARPGDICSRNQRVRCAHEAGNVFAFSARSRRSRASIARFCSAVSPARAPGGSLMGRPQVVQLALKQRIDLLVRKLIDAIDDFDGHVGAANALDTVLSQRLHRALADAGIDL